MKWQLHDAIIEMNCKEEDLRFVSGECQLFCSESQIDVMHQRIYGADETGIQLNA